MSTDCSRLPRCNGPVSIDGPERGRAQMGQGLVESMVILVHGRREFMGAVPSPSSRPHEPPGVLRGAPWKAHTHLIFAPFCRDLLQAGVRRQGDSLDAA
jgi:hypothetical protein